MRDGLGDKKADFISLVCRILGGLIFAFVTGKINKIKSGFFNIMILIIY